MKIHYTDEYASPLFVIESTNIPRIGDKVNLDEVYYVSDLVWIPSKNTVSVILVDNLQQKSEKIKESSDKTSGQLQAMAVKYAELLKEIKSVKSELLNVKQYIKNTPKK